MVGNGKGAMAEAAEAAAAAAWVWSTGLKGCEGKAAAIGDEDEAHE